jgi:hypothetical protein
MLRLRSASVTALVLGVTLSLPACGGHSSTPAAPHVASIATTQPSSGGRPVKPKRATPSDDERPLQRPDSSQAAVLRMWEPYYGCLRDHGIPTLNQHGHLKPLEDPNARNAAKYQACATKEPEMLQTRLARDDPAGFQDRFRRYLSCLRRHGMTATLTAGAPGEYRFDSGDRPMSMGRQMEYSAACETAAFG